MVGRKMYGGQQAPNREVVGTGAPGPPCKEEKPVHGSRLRLSGSSSILASVGEEVGEGEGAPALPCPEGSLSNGKLSPVTLTSWKCQCDGRSRH